MNEAQQEFENAFSGEVYEPGNTTSPKSGYGITPNTLEDPRDADYKEMADTFKSAPEPAVSSIDAAGSEYKTPESSVATSFPVAPAGAVAAKPLPKLSESEPQFKSFGQAFKYHRAQAQNGGPSTFEWNGKKFTTQLKSEVGNQRSPATAAPAASSRASQPKPQAISASAPIAGAQQTRPASAVSASTPAFQPRQAAASEQVKPLHVRQQEAYDEWQRQLSASRTWWGGQAILGPFQKERLQEAEKRFEKLLSETK